MNECYFTFYEDKDFLSDVELESDGDIDERWLEEKTKYMVSHTPSDIQVVFLDMTEREWEEIGLPDSLWGQSRVVDGKIICYGRWHENSDYDKSVNFDEPVRSMNELTISLFHEFGHGGYKIKGKEDLTHAHMYGYKEKRDEDRQDRYEVTPTPFEMAEEILEPGENINFFCIRTEEVTDRWKKEVRDIEQIISNMNTSEDPEENEPEMKELSVRQKHLKPLSQYSWRDNDPESVVLHTLLGTLDGSYSWLEQINLSYNYLIDTDGTIYEQIPHRRSAWHAGVVDDPIPEAESFYGDNNPNKKSVGIAFARETEDRLTKEQAGSCAQLIKHLETRTGNIYGEDNIFSHVDITSYKPPEVRNYRLQVLEALTGGRDPIVRNQTENEEISGLIETLKKALGRLLASISG